MLTSGAMHVSFLHFLHFLFVYPHDHPNISWRAIGFFYMLTDSVDANSTAATAPPSYVPVTGTADGTPVVEIGAVELLVSRSPDPFDGTTTVVLQRVLHIPSAICNGICTRIEGSSQYFRDTPTQGIVHQVNDEQGNPYYYGTRFCGVGSRY